MLKTAFEKHENMRIGNFGQKTMLVDYDKDGSALELGDTRQVVQVSYDKDESAEIAQTADKGIVSLTNLADGNPMVIKNTASTNVATYEKTINLVRKGLLMDYTGVFYDMGSHNDGIYNTDVFGATSIVVFSNNHPNVRNLSWKKLSSHGYHGAFFGISRFGSQQKLCIQFGGSSFASDPSHYIDFNWIDISTDINYLAFASVKETATGVFSLHLELHSFTDENSDPILVAERDFTHVFDILTSNSLNKDQYHSGLDRYLDESYASIVFYETRYYIGVIEGTAKNIIINELLDYWRAVGVDLTYQINYQFAETINDLTITPGSATYHQARMIKLESHQLLSKTFTDNEVLIRGDNLNLLTIRVKVYSESNKWHVDGHGSWSLEFHNGEIKFTDGTTEVLSLVSLTTQFNDYTVVVNPQTIYFYVNGLLHEAKTNTIQMPLSSWDTFDINHHANSVNIYDIVHVKLGINDTAPVIEESYKQNITDFFLHESLTASDVLNEDKTYTTTLTPVFIVEPPSFLRSKTETVFITPNSTDDLSVENSPFITIPNTQSRTFNLTYTFTDNTTFQATIVRTLYDDSAFDENTSSYPPNLTSSEYLLENEYRVFFHLNSTTQGFVVPIQEVDFSYNPDVRLTNGSFTTTVNPVTTVNKVNQQTITINNYAGKLVPLGYYDFDISDRDLSTMNAPSTLIKHIHQTGGQNIVDTNVKEISRYRQPYLKFETRQDLKNKEELSRLLFFVKQDYPNPITSLTINLHIKNDNFTLGDFFVRNADITTTTAPAKAGFVINQQIVFTYHFPKTEELFEIFTRITNQTTQIYTPDDFYMEIIKINDALLPFPTSVYKQSFTYSPTLRFDYTATQVNFEEQIDITVSKNEDNITGFVINLTHRDGLLINFNDFGVGGITQSSLSATQTKFEFIGNHFSSVSETIIKLIVGNDNPYDKVLDSEVQIEIESLTLASTPAILNNQTIYPVFAFGSLSAIKFADYSFQTIDNDFESVSMNIYLNTNRDVKTGLDFWLSWSYGGDFVSGSEEFGIDTQLWKYTTYPETINSFGFDLNGFRFIAERIPQISTNEIRLLSITYTRLRNKVFNSANLFAIVNNIIPLTTISAFPDVSLNEFINRSRDRELIVRPSQSLSPNTLHVDIDLLCAEYQNTSSATIEIWYDASKLTYSSTTTAFPATFTTITVTPITGSYEGFTQGQRIFMTSINVNTNETGSLIDFIQNQFTPADDYIEIDNKDFAVKFVSTYTPTGVLIESTTIPAFNYQIDISITGVISEVVEGVSYKLTTTINQTDEHRFYVRADIFFNADILFTSSENFEAPLTGVSWSEIRRIFTIFYEESSTASQVNPFEMKFYREGFSDDDFRISVTAFPRTTLPSTLSYRSVSNIISFTYTPEFQIRFSPSVEEYDDSITTTVILEKDKRPIRNFSINYLIDDDRTISATLPRQQMLGLGTYTITDQLNVDFTQAGFYTNTNKTTVQYTTTVDGIGDGVVNLPVYKFTMKRRELNYLIDNNDYGGEFQSYEAFHTSAQYFNKQFPADKDAIPFISPHLFLTNVAVSTISQNNHQLSFTFNHPVNATVLKYRIFYRNMFYVDISGPVKTVLAGNPYETEIGFVNGIEFTISGVTTGYTTSISKNFQTDTTMTDFITQYDFLIEIVDSSSDEPVITYDIPLTKYVPSLYLEPLSYNLRAALNLDVFDVSVLNERNYTTYSGNNITNMRAGVADFAANQLITPTNAMIVDTWFYNKQTASTSPLLSFPITYDYVSDGADAMLTCVFKLNSMNAGGDIRVAGHDDMFILELEHSLFPPTVASAYIRFDGFKFNSVAQKIDINPTFYYAVKARLIGNLNNVYAIDIRHWYSSTFPSSSWTEGTAISYTTTRTITNALTNTAFINQPTVSFTYHMDIAQASYRIGRFTFAEFDDTYFFTQFDSHEGTYTNYALLDFRTQTSEWEADWDLYIRPYSLTTIGQSRAMSLQDNYIFKKSFSTGSALWGTDMRIGLIVVFRTNTSAVEQLALFLHGQEKSPPYHQLIVNRNGTDDSVAIELNENNGSTLQQQHLNKLDWEKPQYEYLYYAKFAKQTTPNDLYDIYDIEAKLIGLNNNTNSTFTSVGSPRFWKASSSSSTDLTANLYIGKTIFDGVYGGFDVGYMNYFEFKSDAHSAYEVERIRRDWETIFKY